MRIIIITILLFLTSILNAQPYRLRLDSLKIDHKIFLDGIDRMPFFEGLNDSNQITWPQLSPAVKQQVGAEYVENAPDDVTIELKISGSDTTLGIKSEGVFGTALAPSAKDTMGTVVRDSLITTIAEQSIDIRTHLQNINAASVKNFGAIANQYSSQTLAFQNAFDSDARLVVIGDSPADTFWIRQPVYWRSNKDYEINATVMQFPTDSSNLAVDADSGDTYIVVDDGSVFEVGDWICIMDTSSNFAGGQYGATSTNQKRRLGDGAKITSIVGDTLNLHAALLGGKTTKIGTKGFQVADLARAGTQNSIFIGYDVDNIRIYGRGVIDGNKLNGFHGATPFGLVDYYVDGVKVANRNQQAEFVGNNLPFLACNNVIVEDGLTIKSPININIWFREGKYFWLKKCTIDSAYDKNVLLIFMDYAWVTENVITNAEYEDGIVPYAGNNYVYMTNNYIANNNRGAINIGGNSSHIISSNNYSYNNGCFIRSEGGTDFTSTSDRSIKDGRWYTLEDEDSLDFSSIWLDGAKNFKFVNLRVEDTDGYANIDIQYDCENISFIGGWSKDANRGMRIRRVGTAIPKNITITDMEFANHSLYAVTTTSLLQNIRFDNCVFRNNVEHYEAATNFVNEVDAGNITIINCDSLYNSRTWKHHAFMGGLSIGNVDYPLDSTLVGIDTTGGIDTESMFVYNDVNIFKMPTAQARTWLLSESWEEFGPATGWDTTTTGTIDWDDTDGIIHRAQNLMLEDSVYIYKAMTDTSADETWIFTTFMITDTVKERYVMIFSDADTQAVCYLRINKNDIVPSAHRRFRFRYTTVMSGYNTTIIQDSTLYYLWIRLKPGTGANAEADLYVSTSGVRPQYPEISMTNGNAIRHPGVIRLDGMSDIRIRYDYLLVDDKEIYSIVFF
jgi:hypothetical protein